MKWTKIENPLFFMKKDFVYMTVLATVFFIGRYLLFMANWADADRGDRISFASNRTGNFDIYVMDIDSENLWNLTNHPTNEFGPWAPIGLPAHTWSPDGHFLAYVSRRDGDFKIYIMDTRTREHWHFTDHHERKWAPAWSPDGKQIAYVSLNDYNIYKTDVNGVHLVQLTDFGGSGHPVWSPDGKQIAFVSLSRNRGVKRDGLYVMNADGRNLKWVPEVNKGALGNECAWSPDGKQIAFTLYIRNTQ